MHGQGRPRQRVDRVVMDPVHPSVKRTPVDEAVDAEEVKLVEDGNDQRQAAEIKRMLGEGEQGRIAVGVGDEDADLVGGPDRHAGSEPADEALVVLAAEQEGAVLPVVRELCVVFEARALRARHVEPVLERAVEQKHRDAVDHEQPEGPAPGQSLHHCDVRQHEIGIGCRGGRKEQVPRQKIVRKPFQERKRPGRKHEEGRNVEIGARRPIPALVPFAVFEVIHEWFLQSISTDAPLRKADCSAQAWRLVQARKVEQEFAARLDIVDQRTSKRASRLLLARDSFLLAWPGAAGRARLVQNRAAFPTLRARLLPHGVGKEAGEARRMGCGKQNCNDEVSLRPSRKPASAEAAAHTPSDRLRRPPSPLREEGRPRCFPR